MCENACSRLATRFIMPQTISQNSVNDLLSSFSARERSLLERTPRQRDRRLRTVFRIQWIGFFDVLGSSIFLLARHGLEFLAQHPVLRAIIAQHLLVADGSRYADRSNGSSGEGAASFAARRRRVVTSEILVVNPAVSNLIASGKSNQIYSAMEAGGSQGMQTLEQDLARLWVSGQISEAAAVAMARNPGILRERANRLRHRPTGAAAAAKASSSRSSSRAGQPR